MINNNYRNWIIDYFYHKKITLFWAASFIAIFGPWTLKGCASSGIQEQDAPAVISKSELQTCTVSSIHDGDTMTVKCQGERMKIRLHCIDTPELAQRPWGKESRDYLRSITPDTVQIRSFKKDRYGRTIGEVLDGSTNLNQMMVGSGNAAVYEKYCKDRAYYQLQDAAKTEKAGIWSKPGLQQRPWKYRHNSRN